MLDVATPPARPVPQPSRALPRPRRWTREQITSAILVLALASLLRLPFSDLTPFGHDEALEAARARPIWYGARPVESEITSWWIPDPAGLLYFFALAEAFPRPAVARVELIALANVAAVLICYGLARRFFGREAGLAAGLLYAANPWAATFGRQPWVITQPLLTCLMLLAAMMVVARRDRRWIVPFFVALAAESQTHLLAVLYGPPVALTLLLFPRRWLARELLVGLACAALIVAPFALHLWGIRDGIVDALDRGNRGLTLAPNATAATLVIWLVSGYQLDVKLGLPSTALEALRLPLLGIAWLTSGLLILGIAVAARACLQRRPGWEAHALVLIWFLAPLLLMTWQSSSVYIHYVLVLLPTPFILIALGLSTAFGSSHAFLRRPHPNPLPAGEGVSPLSRWERAGVRAPHDRRAVSGARAPYGLNTLRTVLLVAICTVQAAAVVLFYAALEGSLAAPAAPVTPTDWQAGLNQAELTAKQAGVGEIHGLPLRYWQSVADRAKEAASRLGLQPTGAEGPDVVVITGILDDANRHLDERRKALDYLLGPELSPRFPLEGLTVLPSERDTLYLTLPEQDLPRAASRDVARLGEHPLPGTNGATRLWAVRARSARDLVRPQAGADARFDTGARLLGLDAPARARPGQTIALVSYWLVERDARPDDEDDLPFLELLDALGTSHAYRATGGLPSQQWRPGDVLVQRASLTLPLDLPPGDYRLAAGLASRQDGARAQIPDPPTTDSVPVATLTVRASP